MRRVLLAVLLVAAASIASSVLLARQQAPLPNVPGMPTLGRTLIVNPPQEPVPVVLGAGGQVQPVTLVGIPSVSLIGESLVLARAGRQGWEYRTEPLMAGESPVAALNSAGGEGWEAVGVLAGTGGASQVLLKRPR